MDKTNNDNVPVILFTYPKPADAPCGALGDRHIDTIQRNAFASWVRLTPPPQIVFIGDEHGIEEYAREFAGMYVSDVVKVNEWDVDLLKKEGKPVVEVAPPYNASVRDVFKAAHRFVYEHMYRHHNSDMRAMTCYINSDILLTQEFMDAAQAAWRWWEAQRRADHDLYKSFLMIGQRRDVLVKERWNFDSPTWQEDLKNFALLSGGFHGPAGIDYFLRPMTYPLRDFWEDIPHLLSLGRGYWDNWLVGDALNHGVPVIDATLCVWAIHQGHEVPWMQGNWGHPAILANKQLVEMTGRVAYISHATHIMQPGYTIVEKESHA